MPLQPDAETLMLRRLQDCVQPLDAEKPRYTEAEARAEAHDVFVGQPIARLPKPPGWCHIRCAPSVAAVAIRSHEEQEDAQ